MSSSLYNVHVDANNINLPLPKETRYQASTLEPELCHIHIDASGLLSCPNFKSCVSAEIKTNEDITEGRYNNDDFEFYGMDVNDVWHEFSAVVENSRIVKLMSYGDVLFEAPSN